MLDDDYLDDMMAEFGPNYQPGAAPRLCHAIRGPAVQQLFVPVVSPGPL